MPHHDDRFTRTLNAFDQANLADPRTDIDEQGVAHPSEWLYGRRMSTELARFCPQASEALQLAARAQHLERWMIPRDNFARDRAGYLAWRNALKQRQAQRASELMAAEGYDETLQLRVASLIRKERLKQDVESQTLEDVACLVFLRYGFTQFAQAHDKEKILDIVRKTWRKMSDAGHQAALALPLPATDLALVGEAIAG